MHFKLLQQKKENEKKNNMSHIIYSPTKRRMAKKIVARNAITPYAANPKLMFVTNV